MPTALVLSAGGMFGAYQAGAWNVLSRHFQPDLVVGTSVGALNGWAIAGGCSAADLLAMWREPATAGLTRMRFPLIPWNGCITPAALDRQVRDWYTRFKPVMPYSATVVEVPSLRLVRVPLERITPEHLMASCAIPFGYPPVKINGKLYVGWSGSLRSISWPPAPSRLATRPSRLTASSTWMAACSTSCPSGPRPKWAPPASSP